MKKDYSIEAAMRGLPLLDQVFTYVNRYSVLRAAMTRLTVNEVEHDEDGLPIARLPLRWGPGSQVILLDKDSKPEVRAVLTGDKWIERAPWAWRRIPFNPKADAKTIGRLVVAHENLTWLNLVREARRKSNNQPLTIGRVSSHIVSINAAEEIDFIRQHNLNPVNYGGVHIGFSALGKNLVFNARNHLDNSLLSFPSGEVATLVDPLNHGFYCEMPMRIEDNAVLYNLAMLVQVGSVYFAPYAEHPCNFGLPKEKA